MTNHVFSALLGAGIALAGGWGLFSSVLFTSHDQPVQFSHAIHTGDAVGLTCEDCHLFRDDGTFAGIPTLEQCSSCHAEPLGSSANEQAFVEIYVRNNREVPWFVYSRQPDNVFFPHSVHARKASLECTACHGDHGSSETLRPIELNRISGYSRDLSAMSMDRCIDCHATNNRRSACLDCHQ